MRPYENSWGPRCTQVGVAERVFQHAISRSRSRCVYPRRTSFVAAPDIHERYRIRQHRPDSDTPDRSIWVLMPQSFGSPNKCPGCGAALIILLEDHLSEAPGNVPPSLGARERRSKGEIPLGTTNGLPGVEPFAGVENHFATDKDDCWSVRVSHFPSQELRGVCRSPRRPRRG